MAEREQDILLKIRITKTPEGSAPERIRESWIGIELLAVKLPSEVEERDFTTGQEFGNREGGYMVLVESAINKLRTKSPNAAEWFERNVPSGMKCFSFGPDEVEELPDTTISREDL